MPGGPRRWPVMIEGKTAMSILLVTSSPRGEASLSTKVATELAEELHKALPGSSVVTRDLVKNPLPHIEPAYASGIYTPPESRDAHQSEVVGVSDHAIDELLAADHIILSTGMINFGISSTLKSWIDHIARSGKTFSYGENGPKGLVTGKKVYIVLASGGIYSEGPSAVYDFAIPYLKSVLGFIGITDVEVIRIEGVGMGEEAVARALEKATASVRELAARPLAKAA